jgi:hypothetical protein
MTFDVSSVTVMDAPPEKTIFADMSRESISSSAEPLANS